MKNLALALFSLVILFSCKEDTKNQKEIASLNIEEKVSPLDGVWELVGYYNYEDGKIKDSTKSDANQRQIKIYYKDRVMWSKKRPADSSEWFAYGDYKIEDNTLTETIEYGSKTMVNIMKENNIFSFDLDIKDNTFSQIEVDDEGNRIYSENYKRLK